MTLESAFTQVERLVARFSSLLLPGGQPAFGVLQQF